MAASLGYFTGWWLWIVVPTFGILAILLLLKLCLDFPRLLCSCEEEKVGYSEDEEEEVEDEEEAEEEEEEVPSGCRSIG